jgi:hypothetical protein
MTGSVITLAIAVQVCWFEQVVVSSIDILRNAGIVFLIFVAVLGFGFGQVMGMARRRSAPRNRQQANEYVNKYTTGNAGFRIGFNPRASH